MLEDLARDFQNDELKDKLNDNLGQIKALLQETVVLISAKKN